MEENQTLESRGGRRPKVEREEKLFCLLEGQVWVGPGDRGTWVGG